MLTIQRLDGSRWAILRNVRLAALLDAPEAFWATWQDESQNTRQDWIAFARHVIWFTALDNAAPSRVNVGLVGCLQRPEFPDEPEIIGMWVAPDRRGTGPADLLITAVHRWGAANGVRAMGLWVVEDNHRAKRFYERHHYRLTGERAPLPAGRHGHEQRMRRTWPRSSDAGPAEASRFTS